jgi:hypothetical protein
MAANSKPPASSSGFNPSEHPIIIVLGMLLSAFLAGWGGATVARRERRRMLE